MAHHHHPRAWSLLAGVAAIILISLATTSFAADSPARSRKAKAARSRAAAPAKAPAPAVASAGLRVAIDPQTGQVIAPTLEQRHALGASADLSRSSDGLVILTLPDGTQLCHLEGRFQEYVVARKDGAGNVSTDCVESHDRARRLQAMPVVARPGHVRSAESSRVKE